MDEHEARAVERRVRDYAAQEMPALAQGRVVLATSGGADSAATVALLCGPGLVRHEHAVVAHFDHGLRGEDAAARDADVVRALCARFGLPPETGAWARPRAGEAAARAARYAFLAEVARTHSARAIVTGHTSDDQVETVLMHTMRGAGLRGLGGMAPVSPLPVIGSASGNRPVELWRPLLCVTREETRAYCALRGIAYVDDPTNADMRFQRNRVRLELLPQIEARDPDARDALLALSRGARESVASLDAVASTAVIADDRLRAEVSLSRDRLRSLPADAVPYAYRLAIVRLLGDARDIDRRHYRTLAVAASAATGSTFELPRGLVATVDASAVVLSLGPPGPPPIASGMARALPWSGEIGVWSVAVTPHRAIGSGAGTSASDVSGERTALALPARAVLRGRKAGDRIALRGGGHKKLQDVYVDAKVTRREREAAPVIAFGADVLWSPLAAHIIAPLATGEAYLVEWQRAASRLCACSPPPFSSLP